MNVDIDARKRAEAALRESEERRDLALEATQLGTFVWHVKEDRSELDARMHALFDLPPDGKLTLHDALATMIHPDDAASHAAAVAEACDPAGSRQLQTNIRVRRADGGWRWLEISGRVSFGQDGQPLRMAGTVLDVTDRKRAEAELRESEERQAFLLKLGDALRGETDEQQVERVALDMLADQLSVDRAYITTSDYGKGETQVPVEVRRGELPPLVGTFRHADFPESAQQVNEGTLVVEDVETDTSLSELNRRSFAAVQIEALIGVGLRKGVGDIFWTLAVAMTEPRNWSPNEVLLMEEAAERIMAALERARAEAALRESEVLRRVALSGGRMGTWHWDLDAGVCGGDAQFMALWGFPPTDAPRPLTDYTDRMTPEGAAEMAEIVSRAVAAGEEFDGSLEIVAGPTAGRWVRWRGRAADVFRRVLDGVTFDITEQKQAELALRESEERQAFLLRLSDALRPLGDPIEIMATASALTGPHLGLDRCFYGEVDAASEHAYVADSYCARGVPPFPQRIRIDAFGEELVATITTGATLAVVDIRNEPRLADPAQRGRYLAAQLQAFVGVPLVKGGRLVAILSAHQSSARQWTRNDIVLLEEVAERTWAAVERARAEARLRESEARLRALATAGGSIVYRMSPDWRLMRQLDGRDLLADTAEAAESWAEGYILPEDRSAVFAAIEAAIRARSVFELEHRVRRADGGVAWVLSRAVPMLGPNGEIAEWFGAASDVTGRKEAEEALRTSEERLRTALSISTVGVMFWNGDGALVDANDAFLGMTGFTREEALGKTWVELTPPEFQERSTRFVEEVERTGEGSPYEKQYYRRDGSRWWGLFAARKLGGGIVEFVLDVSDRREAEAALHESEERFRSFAENSAATLWIIDAETNRIEYLSPAFERMWGEPRGAIMADLGRWAELVHEQDRERASAGLPRLLAGEGLTQEYRVVRPSDGAVRWIRDTGFPIRDEAGRVRRVAGMAQDVTLAKQAEARLAESEARLRQFGEASSDILWARDAETLQWEYLTPAFEAIYGVSRDEALAGDSMRNWVELIHPEDRERAVASIDRVRHGERVTFEYRVRRPVDGEVRWLRNTDFPIRDEAGRVVRIGGVGQDVTELKRVEAALQDSEERLRTLMEGIPQLVWRSCDRGRWTWASPQWCAFTGQADEESHGLGWLDAVHPDDHAATLAAWEEARPHGMLDAEYRVRRAADGRYLWHHTRSVPVRDEAGRIVEWLGTSTDVQQLKELQERQAVMVAELQHRTRNLIAVVRSVASQTMAETGPTEAFRRELNHRLEALARVQGLLSRAGEAPITIEALIRMELDALGALNGTGERVTIAGPPVRLRNSVVQTLALAVHELATNARKYGALAGERGRLQVTWDLREADGEGRRLALDWVEEGVERAPEQASPAGGGYGRELIERALPYALGAKTRYELTGDGVRCGIDLPLERGRSRRSR